LPDLLPYGRQWISDEDVAAVAEALRSDLITQGPLIERFERAVTDRLGARHAVAVTSGTAALHAAAHAAGLGPGDELITSPMTFSASANCALYMGAEPRFVDITPTDWNIDGRAATSAAGERTRAIVAVSYAGLPVDLRPFDGLRGRVVLIEDAAHAIGAHRHGRMVGGPGGADMTVFSFHPVKTITTGEGGLITTEDDELARRLRVFRTHGITHDGVERGPTDGAWRYDMQTLGFNYRITDFQCALGISQLARLDEWVARRNELARRYRELLADEKRVELPPEAPAGSLHGYHLFVVRVRAGAEARLRAFERLREAGIWVQVHYIPVYRLHHYRETLGYPQDECPVTESLYAGAISLPMFPAMADSDVDRVAGELGAALG
jgi:UDP-4-amino-4,6-dideoxy-N-acetyl-beta-L-altrosamine transaminase